ncbi:MAG: sulfatase [Acidobacteriota bacterium]
MEAAHAAIVQRFPLAAAAWLIAMGAGSYGLFAAPIPVLLRLKSGAAVLSATLAAMAVAISAVLVQRRWYSTVHPDARRLFLEIAARLAIVAGIAAITLALARAVSRRPAGDALARVCRSRAAAAACAIVPSTAILLAAIDARHDPLEDTRTTLGPAATGEARGPSIVLVLIDTLRADRVGAYGSADGTTPFLDRLSRSGTAFSDNLSHASWTKSETASILSSLPPAVHGAGPEGGALADDVLTLPEALTADGYRTLGFSTNGVVSPTFGLSQGFSEFRYVASTRPRIQAFYGLDGIRFLGGVLGAPIYLSSAYGATADVAVDAVSRRLARGIDGPAFLYVHLMDPHSPYLSPPGRGLSRRTLNYVGRRASTEAAYDAEVAFADAEIERLRRTLGRNAAFEGCIFAVTSDHGEEFYEHGNISHGKTLYEEMLRVPLVVCAPGSQPSLVTHRVRGIDLAPALLARAGLPIPSAFQGQDPLDPPVAGPMVHQEDFGGRHLRALRDGDLKLIAHVGTSTPYDELYDLSVDPREQHDLVRERSDLAATMQMTREAREAFAAMPAISPDAQAILRGLGYIE